MEQRVGGVGSGNHKIISQLAGLKRVSKSFVKTEVVEGQSEWLQKNFSYLFCKRRILSQKSQFQLAGLKRVFKGL